MGEQVVPGASPVTRPALRLVLLMSNPGLDRHDLLRSSFDARAVASDIGDMQRALVDRGCMVLTFTIPDISRRLAMGPFARMLSRRTLALNDEIRRVSSANGAILLDLAAYDLAVDPRMWSRDRLHANAEGHARTAAALAQVLGLPGSDDSWRALLPAPPPIGLRARIAEDLAWGRGYFVPWLWRRMRGRSAGDHRTAKLPALTPIRAAPVGER